MKPAKTYLSCRLPAVILAALLIAACDPASSSPTQTPAGPTLPPPLAASPTVNPLPPVEEGDDVHDPSVMAGVSNPTQAALAAEGQPDTDLPTTTPLPTVESFPMPISAADGLVLQSTFYGARVRPAPAILMLPMEGRDRTSWDVLAHRLQAQGYAVLTLDLRGSGETGGAADWALAPGDVSTALAQLAQLPGVSQVITVGAGIGANLALNACADSSACAAAVLLSPGLDTQGITTAGAITKLGVRPVLILAAENDQNNPADSVSLDGMAAGDHQLKLYPAGHGTDLLTVQPDSVELIAGWLAAHVPPG